ncbi:MAG: aspartate kinase [Bacteroidales bacterium]|jgi:aspartate kinase|nr:aspartate kinase [Bacteroidales bacterium]
MKVYKFGGASVKDAAGIRNLAKIVSKEKENLVVVVSAFGKTTNALEKVLKAWMEGDKSYKDHLDNIYSYHASIADELFPSGNSARGNIDNSFAKLREYLRSSKRSSFDFEYDQIVSYGEIWSTMIVAEYLRKSGINAAWVDIRKALLTDDRYRDANILWNESTSMIRAAFDFRKFPLYVTQGFIGSTAAGWSTTLGREGSDYTAAILANMLDAGSVTVWKDVPGVLNADPKWLNDARKMEEISYKEAVEMTFSGAKVIHPKTIKPLHNKNIPLHVRSFIDPDEPGTIVKADATLKKTMPVFIRKENQLLISILPRDFSFVMGDNLSRIFHTFIKHGIKVNLVEASAVAIDVCVDDERPKIESLLVDLETEYSALYNENTEMLTIRHYTPEAITRITSGREILLEQRMRSTVRFVVREGIASSLRSSQ